MGSIILKNNGYTTKIVNGIPFSGLTEEPNTNYLGFDPITNNLESLSPSGQTTTYGEGGGFTGGSVNGITASTISATTYQNLPCNMESVTYSELVNLITGSTLCEGKYYLISDFQTCYDQPDFDYDSNAISSVTTYHTANIEPLMVLAISSNTISDIAFQPLYPNDSIKYDWTWNTTEFTFSPAKGRITERIDEFNNRTDYDHRNILFKRYRSYFVDFNISGRITGMNNGVVTGLNTNFSGNCNVGDVILIYSNTPKLYEITEITSSSGMTVVGFSYDNFTDSVGYECDLMFSNPTAVSGTLYYFNDVPDGEGIDDGGNDMYDGGNYLNTNLSNNIPMTHTRMSNPPVNTFEMASLSDFTYDGSVQSGDTYFGVGSNYFTNLYPGLFVMSAYDVDINEFFVSGGLGADGGGTYEIYTNTLSGYSVYGKFVYGAAPDPSVNHLIIVDEINNNIIHNYSTNTNDDDDSISGLTSATTQIHYLLFALGQGIKPTNTQITNIVNSYLSTIDETNINTTLSSLNNSFTAITSNLPENQVAYKSLNYKQTNITGDTENYQEYPTFDLFNDCINNYIGNFSYLFQIENEPFILANNVFYQNSYINNTFGDACFNNTFDDDCSDNIVGNYFYNNVTDDDFDQNIIGNYFYNNYITSNFQRNRIDYNFYNNTIVNNDFNRNEIGCDFNNNVIFSNDFVDNKIGNQFESNKIENSFQYNVLGRGFYNNRVLGYFSSNRLGSFFFDNQIYCDYEFNDLGESVNNNVFGDSNSIGAYKFAYNKVDNIFYNNNIAGDFQYNEIGNNFYGNIIGDGFGFGFITSQGNKIGNFFYDNTIGEYFYNNTIADGFYSNTISDYFQKNDVKYSLSSTDFTSSTNVYGDYNCTLFVNSTLSSRLSFYDGSDVLNITNITD